MNRQPFTVTRYVLCCLSCGRINPYLFGVPPRVRPCRHCGKPGHVGVCIVTLTGERCDLNATRFTGEDARHLGLAQSKDQSTM